MASNWFKKIAQAAVSLQKGTHSSTGAPIYFLISADNALHKQLGRQGLGFSWYDARKMWWMYASRMNSRIFNGLQDLNIDASVAVNDPEREIYETFGNVSEWEDGQLAILSSFGWRDLCVVEVVGWNNVPYLSDEYTAVDEDTIKTDRGNGYSWRRNEAVPFKILQTYSDDSTGQSRYHKAGTVNLAGPQNLYHSLDDLIKKESRSLYPDMVLQLANKKHINALIKDFPELVRDQNFAGNVDYQIFDIQGYEVQVLNDVRQMERNPGIMKTRGTEGMFYWHIPDLGTRSTEDKEGIDRQPWGTGRYPTMQLAIQSADKYISHLFYGGGDELAQET